MKQVNKEDVVLDESLIEEAIRQLEEEIDSAVICQMKQKGIYKVHL